MANAVAPPDKQRRSKRLLALSLERRIQHARRGVSRTVPVLVESRRVGGRLRGYSDCYIPVAFEGPDAWMNTLVDVELTDVDGYVASGVAR